MYTLERTSFRSNKHIQRFLISNRASPLLFSFWNSILDLAIAVLHVKHDHNFWLLEFNKTQWVLEQACGENGRQPDQTDRDTTTWEYWLKLVRINVIRITEAQPFIAFRVRTVLGPPIIKNLPSFCVWHSSTRKAIYVRCCNPRPFGDNIAWGLAQCW